jgi:dual specificity MAP kinase phosphatase
MPPVYSINASQLAETIEDQATQPLPDPKWVFPWLHGLHPDNAIQLAFFVARRKSLRKTPQSLRGITIVKVGGDLNTCKLKGAISANEILTGESLSPLSSAASFLEADPREGFSVRNFQIQPCKMATVSDIILYGSDETDADEILFLAKKISRAQRAWKENMASMGWETGIFNTFVVLGVSLNQDT